MTTMVWPVRGLAIGMTVAGLVLGRQLLTGEQLSGYWLPLLSVCWSALAGGTIYLTVTYRNPKPSPGEVSARPPRAASLDRARLVLDVVELGFFTGVVAVTAPLMMMIMKQA